MEITNQIEIFHEFFDTMYRKQVDNSIKQNESYIIVNFNDLNEFNHNLAQELINNPQDSLRAGEISIEQLDVPNAKEFKIRFKNLPKSEEVMIRDIGIKHINKLVRIVGVVKNKSALGVQAISTKYECPSCGNIIKISQSNIKFQEPNKCGCGRKGKFQPLDTKMIDAQTIILAESLKDKLAPVIKVFLTRDLVSPVSEKNIRLEQECIITGIVKDELLPSKDGGKLNLCDFSIDVNYIEPLTQISVNMRGSD